MRGNDDGDIDETSQGLLSRRDSLSDHESVSDTEDVDIGTDGIRLGLLSRKARPSEEPRTPISKDLNNRELITGILRETVPTLLSTVIGMIIAGELLERISTWRAVKQLDELFILIPMLNNMKGNLEMNLSARLSTAANTGQLDQAETRRAILAGNLSLLQVQAIALSFIAALFSFALGKMVPALAEETPSESENPAFSLLRSLTRRKRRRHGFRRSVTHPSKLPASKTKSGFPEFLAVSATAFSSASLSALILGSFMHTIILVCRRLRLNPDNISPPLASCLGDLLTLTLISLMATLITSPALSFIPLPVLFIIVILCVLVGTLFITLRNDISRPLVREGWVPLLCAMVISSGTGLVLDSFVTKWEGFGGLAIVISGLPGSIGSVFVSRLSTNLHAHAEAEDRPSRGNSSTLGNGGSEERPLMTSITLFAVGLPVILSYLVFVCTAGWLEVPFLFLCIFLMAFCLSTTFSLYLAHTLTNALWKRGYDPDTFCLPVHSSVVDLVGQCMLVGAYVAASGLGAQVQARPIT